MGYSTLLKTRVLLGDPAGVLGLGAQELTGLLDRGARDAARRGLLTQQFEVIETQSGVRTYELAAEHMDTFTLFRERYTASVRLLSQDGSVWYLWVEETGIVTLSDTPPAGIVLRDTEDISWLEYQSPDTTTWYVFPSPMGTLVQSWTRPDVGTGLVGGVELRDRWGTPWYLAVNDLGMLIVSMRGTAATVAPDLQDHSMQRVEPEAIERLDAWAVSGPPERYALTSKLLWVHPTPNDRYQLLHFYFADLPTALPRAAGYLPVLFATATGLQRTQRTAPAQQLLGMYATELTIHTQNLYPGSRDGMTVYTMPQ